MSELKSGRFSKEEQQFIRDNIYSMVYIDIADTLNRSPDSVKSWIEKNLDVEPTLDVTSKPIKSRNDLKKKAIWKILARQFTEDELETVEYYWGEIMEQFDNDVLPTEESQVMDIIKFSLLMDRNLQEQREARDMCQLLENNLRANPDLDDDKKQELHGQLMAYKGLVGPLKQEYVKYQDSKNKILAELKGTRRDRITKIDSQKESFTAWLEQIINNPARRSEYGRYAEKMRLAMIDEQVRLAAYHKYDDGKIDQPFLNHETVKEDNV